MSCTGVSQVLVASRVVASAACQAGPSGRDVNPAPHGRIQRQSATTVFAAHDVGRRAGKQPRGSTASSTTSWRGAELVRHGRQRTPRAAAQRGVVTLATAGGPTSGRGSRITPVLSTLVPEAETAEADSGVSVDVGAPDASLASEVEEDKAVTLARRVLPSGLEIVVARDMPEFEVAAELRATAFYEDLESRQALPFPPRFVATFRREFAQRERRALKERTAQPSGPSRRCLCLMSRLPDLGLVGCLDVSTRVGPCASQVNGVCVNEGEEYVYIDNVAVDAAARRRGSASAMLEASSDIAMSWGAGVIYTHVHADNLAARRLYHAYGFRAPKGQSIADAMPPGKGAQWASPRLAGLVLLRAPLPLMQAASEKAAAAVGDCTCGGKFPDCDECICHPV